MIYTSFQNAMKFILIPTLLLTLLLSFSNTLFHFSQNILVVQYLELKQIPPLQAYIVIPQVILALILLIFSIYQPFEKIFRGILAICIGIITLLTAFICVQGHIDFHWMAENVKMNEPLTAPWSLNLYYVVLRIVNFNLYSLLIWGFINRIATLSEGKKYYIPLAFAITITANLLSQIGLISIGASKLPLVAMVFIALVLMISAYFAFNWSWKRLPDTLLDPQDLSPILQTRFPYLSAAYLLAGAMLARNFLDPLFKFDIKNQLSNPAAYSQFIGNYSTAVGSATIGIGIIWAILGTWLLSKKGWKITALYASLSLFIGGILSLSLPFSWLNQGIFHGLLTSTTTTLFFPLVQLLYLYLPYQKRFRTKIAIEMIAVPIMKGLSPWAIQGLLVAFGSIAAIALYLKVLVLALIGLLLVASYKARPKCLDIPS